MSETPVSSFVQQVREALSAWASADAVQGVLDRVLSHFGCAAGTIHRAAPGTGALELVAQRGIPPTVLERIRNIPLGKGMAGLAAERREPVAVCNLQTDRSGDVRPGARQTGMEGSIAVPMLVAGSVRGVLGVAKPSAYEFGAAERQALLAVAAAIGEHLP